MEVQETAGSSAPKKRLKCRLPKNDKSKNKKSLIFFVGLFVAELMGTAILMFFGCMGCLTEIQPMPVPSHMSAISFGLTVLLVMQCFGHISGSHINPSVTMAAVILQLLPVKVAPLYFIGQFAGAILGLAALKMLVPPEYLAREIFDARSNNTVRRLGLCTTAPHPKVSTIQALIIETIITAVLILVCCSIWDKRNERNSDSMPVRFGFVVGTICIAAAPFTGSSINTARSFAPAFLNGEWKDHWVYWVGPTAGSLIAVSFYSGLYSLPKEKARASSEDRA